MNITRFIREIPKAELHMHLEGSLQAELMFKIAHRNNIQLDYKSVEDLKLAYQFFCLQDFLDIYYTATSVLKNEQDFYELTMDYFNQCKKENIVLTEIMFDPQSHTKRGVLFSTIINGIQRAREDAKKQYGIESLVIMNYLRHLSEDDAFETLEQSLPYKHLIHAVGLDSSEKDNPPSKFLRVFEASAEAGYTLVSHAGEEGDPDYVWQAIDLLKIARIDHGNSSLKDEKLVGEIIKRNLALTICPLSNLSLKGVRSLEEHPLRIMLRKGMNVTINSDDPAYFGGYLTENFLQIQQALNLTRDEIILLVKNGFTYSFVEDSLKTKFLEKVNDFCLHNLN